MPVRNSFLIAICLMASLAMGQTTQPARRFMRFGQRIQELTAQLDLTDDQKQKIDDIIQQARQEFQQQAPALRDATPKERQAKIKEILEGMREEIGDLLTLQQKEKLQQLIAKEQPENPQDNKGNAAALSRPAAALLHKTSIPPATRPGEALAAAPVTPAYSGTADVGQTAPELPLRWASGQPLHISSFKNSVVVLIFGSYTTPTFRDKAPALPHLAEMYHGRARFIIIYTKEAHPSDGWTVERNKHDDIEIPQPTDLAGRQKLAEQAKTNLHLADIPMVMDTMDDKAASAYGAFPNGVVIIGKDGKIAARQHWLEPTALPAMIDAALKR